MKKLLLMLPVFGLFSCTAPSGTDDGPAADSASFHPEASRRRFGMGSGYVESQPEGRKADPAVSPPKSDAKPAAAEETATRPKSNSFFSFFRKKEAPKALVVEAPPVRKKSSRVVKESSAETELPNPSKPGNDGLRLPPMLELPGENEFEASNPAAAKPAGSGVTVRPPTDPPSRPKPTEDP
jgi:hypothetical protein